MRRYSPVKTNTTETVHEQDTGETPTAAVSESDSTVDESAYDEELERKKKEKLNEDYRKKRRKLNAVLRKHG